MKVVRLLNKDKKEKTALELSQLLDYKTIIRVSSDAQVPFNVFYIFLA